MTAPAEYRPKGYALTALEPTEAEARTDLFAVDDAEGVEASEAEEAADVVEESIEVVRARAFASRYAEEVVVQLQRAFGIPVVLEVEEVEGSDVVRDPEKRPDWRSYLVDADGGGLVGLSVEGPLLSEIAAARLGARYDEEHSVVEPAPRPTPLARRLFRPAGQLMLDAVRRAGPRALGQLQASEITDDRLWEGLWSRPGLMRIRWTSTQPVPGVVELIGPSTLWAQL